MKASGFIKREVGREIGKGGWEVGRGVERENVL